MFSTEKFLDSQARVLAARRSFVGTEWALVCLMLIAAFLDSFNPVSLSLVVALPLILLGFSLAADRHLTRWRSQGESVVTIQLAIHAVIHTTAFLFLMSAGMAWLAVITISTATEVARVTAVLLEAGLLSVCIVMTPVYAPRLLGGVLPGQSENDSPPLHGTTLFILIPLITAGIPLVIILSLLTPEEPATAIAGLSVVGTMSVYFALLACALLYLIFALRRIHKS